VADSPPQETANTIMSATNITATRLGSNPYSSMS
jgi:hypothetical protein